MTQMIPISLSCSAATVAADTDAKLKALSNCLSSLDAWAAVAQTSLAWMTGVVVLGLIIEYWDDVRELRHAWRNKRIGLSLHLELDPVWHSARAVIGGVLVVFGVMGELAVGVGVGALENAQSSDSVQVAALLGAEASTANQQAANALLKAGELGVSFDNLNAYVAGKEREMNGQFAQFKAYAAEEHKKNDAVVADLNSDKANLDKARSDALAAAQGTKKDLSDMTDLLAKERAVRQEIVAAIKLRELKPDAAARVVAKVKSFGPVTFDQGIVAFDDMLFLQELNLEVWPQIGWKDEGSIDRKAIPLLEGSKGIRVLYDSAHAGKFKGPAKAFADALSDEGIPSTAEAISDPRLNPEVIHVFIGAR